MASIDEVNDIAPIDQYEASASQTAFDYSFPITAEADLVVYDNDTLQVLTTDYTVTGVGADTGGTITFVVGRTAGRIITIYRDIAIDRLSDFQQNGPLSSVTFNDELDKITLILQQLERDVARAVRMSLRNAQASADLELDSAFEGKYLFVNTDGELEPAAAVATTTLTQSIIGELLYPQTTAEAALPVTPVFTIHAPSPRIDVRRYLTAWDDGSVQTTGLQNAINYAFARKGRLILPDGLDVATGALTLTMTGNRFTCGLAIEGAGPNSSIIKQSGTPTEVLNFSGETPTSNPTEAQLVLENFTVKQAAMAKTAHGITLNGIGGFRLSNVHLQGFDRALNLSSALIGTVDQDSYLGDSNYGAYIRRNGAGSTTNLLRFRDCRININSSWGIDYNGGSQLQLHNNDLEANGTTTVTTTGAIAIRGALAPDSLVAGVLMDGNWLESNFGQSLLVEAPTGGVTTDLDIRGGNIIGAESGRAIKVLGGSRVSIRNLQCLTPGDTWDITCGQLVLENCVTGTLTDTGVTYPHYTNLVTSASTMINGRRDSFNGVLTGCDTSPAVPVTVWQKGDQIELEFTSTLATSNATTCTVTGLPARYRPAANKNITVISRDNGVDDIHPGAVDTAGVVDLWLNGTFTASGSKGVRNCRATYRLT